MADGAGPRKRFAEELKSARELHAEGALSQTDLARKVRTSKSTISRLESSASPIPAELPVLLDQVFATDGLFKRLAVQAAAQTFPELYRRRMELERGAVRIWEWSPTVIPGLLQTEAYAQALLRAGAPRATDQEISADVVKRRTRQEVLRGDSPPDLRVVLCESVLRRRVTLPDVMRDQLKTLLEHNDRQTTSIQVLPLDAEAHLLIETGATLLTAPTLSTVVCVEAYRTAGIIDDPEAVQAAVRAFEGMISEAHSPRTSASLIRELMETL